MDDAVAALVDSASEDLQFAVRQAARSGIGALEACHGSLARSIARLETATARWAADPATRGRDAQRSVDRFRAELQIYAALHHTAGMFCAAWGRALGGPGGQAYAPPGGGALPAVVSGGRRISFEA
jgi:hypothetical protein